MKSFLTYSAVIEMLTGLGLLFFPIPLISLLFGSPLEGESGKIVAWIAGAAILSFAILCYLLREELNIRKGVLTMLIYNFLLSLIFIFGLLKNELSGAGSLLVLSFHSVQTIISFVLLFKQASLSK